MIRALAMVAVAGFVLAIAALSGAFALGGPEAIARGGWTIASSDHDWNFGNHNGSRRLGPETTRTLTWTGGDTLKVSVPADVEYVQAVGAPSITVTGPQRLVDRVVVEDGRIVDKGGEFGWRHRHVKIRMTAPNVTHFGLSGSSELVIRDYKQDRLSLDLSGSSEVEATGEVRLVEVEISGSGEVELAGLTTKEAEVDISGSGEATIAPTERANIEISGSGDVTLTTDPKQITTDVSGSGDINRRGGGDVEPTLPTPPPVPSKKT
jgi:hypothetical protein